MPSTTVRSPGRPARSTRDAPGPADGSSDPGPPRDPTRTPRFVPPKHRDRSRRDRRFAIGLSIALHVLLLVLLVTTDTVRLPDLASLLEEPARGPAVVYMPIDGFPGPRTTAAPLPAASPVAEAPMGAPIRAPVADRAGAPAPSVAAPPAALPSGGGGVPDAAVGGSGAGVAAATPARDRFNRAVEALRPRSMSPLLRDATLDGLRTNEERAALRAYARIRALNDSILAEMEAGQRATDWTWTDDEGRRWGISPGKLHLGGITIPLPISTAGSREDRELMREWQEIQAQAEQGLIDETFDDRVEAIRAQRDAERAEE